MVLLGSYFPRAWEGQPLWVGRVVYSRCSSFPGTPLGGANHISLSPVISQNVLPQQSIEKALCHSGESQFALQAAAVALYSWSQLYSQQHFPGAFSLIKVQSQRSSSSSCTIQLEPTVQLAAFALSILTDQGTVTAQ